MEVKVLSGLREPARVNLESQPQEAQTSQSTFAEVLENKAYVSFTLKAMLFYFGWMMSQPLFTIYYVRVLNCGVYAVAVFSLLRASHDTYRFPDGAGARRRRKCVGSCCGYSRNGVDSVDGCHISMGMA